MAVCVVKESRRRAGERVFRMRTLAVRQESRGQGLARQAIVKVQKRIESLLAAGMQGHGGHKDRGYCMLADLAMPCMQF